MKKLVCLSVLLALAASASASVDFFFTSSLDPYGLNDPSLAFLYSKGNGTDYLDGYKLSAAGAPPYGPGMPDVQLDISAGQPDQWAYIWGRFNNEAGAPTINGISLKVNGAQAGPGWICAYKLNNLNDFEIERMRWDGDEEVFYFNPPGMVAVTANGIRNVPSNVPWNLYIGGDHRVFLLGAVRPHQAGELTMSFGPIPVNYKEEPTIPNPSVNALNKVIVIPEPASLMLLGLAALALRRR